MEIQFCGGAQVVTGSQFLLKVNNVSILIECGLLQGRRQECWEKNRHFPYNPSTVHAVILTHAHIDHSGNVPNLVKQGFKGRIYTTAPTADLCRLMFHDSAHLQEIDLFWVNKIRKKKGLPPFKPLYTKDDADEANELFDAKNYNESFEVAPGIEITLRDAGHILGAATVRVDIKEGKKSYCLSFSGDIGRPGIPVTLDPEHVFDPDILIMESTYGNRLHPSFDTVEEELVQAVNETAIRGGKIIIPAFALGRTQLLVYLFHKLFMQNRIPDIPVFVDSPLASQTTRVFQNYENLLDRETDRIFLQSHQDPFEFSRLKYVGDAEESKSLNYLSYPHIIISASGMAEGGRILHHLRNGLGNSKNLVLIVGYSAKHTLARKLGDGEKTVRIFGEEHKVRCQVKMLDNFSAHADRKDLLNYVRRTKPEKLQTIFLVHGEPEQALPLRDALRSNGYMNIIYPEFNQRFTF